ncbi:hypothetical protein KIPB_003453, partial [Kipferlia bialata]
WLDMDASDSYLTLVFDLVFRPPTVAACVLVVMISVVKYNWRSAVSTEDTLDSQARQMSGAIQTALGIFTSALPKRTQNYVIRPRTAGEEMASIGALEASDSSSYSDSGDLFGGCYGGPTSTHEGAPGMIRTDDNAVISFVGVTTRTNLPAIEYIRDITVLFSALDGVISAYAPGVEKVKGADGFLICRSMERDTPMGPDRGRERLAADCRVMCQFCLLANATVAYCRRQGYRLDTIESLRSGVACGSVTSGVLGSQELMYDVFGDTVNTAARLMNKARPWQVLVTEAVARAARPSPSSHPKPGSLPPLGLVQRKFRLPLVMSASLPLYLKGKGDCTVNRVTVAQDGTSLLLSTLDSILGHDLSSEGTEDSRDSRGESSMESSMLTGRGSMGSVSNTSRSAVVDTDQDSTLASILGAPWECIRARFDAAEYSSSHGGLAKSLSRSLMPAASYSGVSLAPHDTSGEGGDRQGERVSGLARQTSLPDSMTAHIDRQRGPIREIGSESTSERSLSHHVSSSECESDSLGHEVRGVRSETSEPSETSEMSEEQGVGCVRTPCSLLADPTTAFPMDHTLDRHVHTLSVPRLPTARTGTMYGDGEESSSASSQPTVPAVPTVPVEDDADDGFASMYIRVQQDRENVVASVMQSILTPHTASVHTASVHAEQCMVMDHNGCSSMGSTGTDSGSECTPGFEGVEGERERGDDGQYLTLCKQLSVSSLPPSTGGVCIEGVEGERERECRDSMSEALYSLDGVMLDDLQTLDESIPKDSPMGVLVHKHRHHSGLASKRKDPGMPSLADVSRLTGKEIRYHMIMASIQGMGLPKREVLQNLFSVFLDISNVQNVYLPAVWLMVAQIGIGILTLVMSIATSANTLFVSLMVCIIVGSILKLVFFVMAHVRGLRTFERVLLGALDPKRSGSWRDTVNKALSPYRSMVWLNVLLGDTVVVLACIALVVIGGDIKDATEAGLDGGLVTDVLTDVWMVILLLTVDSCVCVLAFPNHVVVLHQWLRVLLYGLFALYDCLTLPGYNFLTLAVPIVSGYSVTQAVMQTVSMHVGVTFIVEVVAAKVLVSRVASGRYMNPLTPALARTSNFFAPMDKAAAVRVMRIIDEHHISTAIEGTVLLSLFHDQIKELACSGDACQAKDTATSDRTETDSEAIGFVSGVMDSVYQSAVDPSSAFVLQTPTSPAVGTLFHTPSRVTTPQLDPLDLDGLEAGVLETSLLPCSESSSTVQSASQITLYGTTDEQCLMGQTGIQYYPLMLYAKLDIARFTSYCTEHGSQVVNILSVMFTACDRVVAKYEAAGIVKVKTVGDAFEVMRPFTPDELKGLTMGDIARVVALTVQASHELSACAQRVFKALQVPMDIRCGVAMGPGFASLLGRFRVAHEVFGLASTHGRLMESLAPLNGVAVCTNIHALLERSQRNRSFIPSFSFGSRVISSVEPGVESKYDLHCDSESRDSYGEAYLAAFARYSHCVSDCDASLSLPLMGVGESVRDGKGGRSSRDTLDPASQDIGTHVHIREGYADDRGIEGVILLGVNK